VRLLQHLAGVIAARPSFAIVSRLAALICQIVTRSGDAAR
jgi:hypothetical protein